MVGNPIDEVAYTKVEQENVIKIENLDQRVTIGCLPQSLQFAKSPIGSIMSMVARQTI